MVCGSFTEFSNQLSVTAHLSPLWPLLLLFSLDNSRHVGVKGLVDVTQAGRAASIISKHFFLSLGEVNEDLHKRWYKEAKVKGMNI